MPSWKSRIPPLTPRRVLGLSSFFVVALAAALHLALLYAWSRSIAPELEASRFPDQLHHETVTAFPTPSPGWPLLRLPDVSLRAPLADPELDVARACASRCQLALDAGKLTLFDEPLDKPYSELAIQLTPDRDEIGWLRSPWHNWRTIRSLAARVTLPNVLPDTERFIAAGSRGVLTHFHSNDNDRWVVYAYAGRGGASRKLALSGTTRETLLALLATIEFRKAR